MASRDASPSALVLCIFSQLHLNEERGLSLSSMLFKVFSYQAVFVVSGLGIDIFFWLQAAVPPAIASSQPVWNLNNSGAIRFLSTVCASQKGYLNWMKNNDTYFSFRQMLQFCLNAILSDWKRTLARLCASRVLPGFAYAWPSLAGLPRGSEQAVLWTRSFPRGWDPSGDLL